MRFKIQDLLTLLIGLFLFSSCKDSSSIGLDLEAGTEIQGTLVDTASVWSRTQKEPLISTFKIARHPIGYMADPTFGTTEASIAFTLTSPDALSDYEFTASSVLDSAILVLNFGRELYADTATSTYRFEVRPLVNKLAGLPSYLASATYPAMPTIIGSKTGKLFPNTKLKIMEIVPTKADTLRTTTPQIRIKLDNAFITSLLFPLPVATIENQTTLSEAIKGFKLDLNRSASSGPLGMLFFDFAGVQSKLEVYYKKTNALVTTAIDSVHVDFPITNAGSVPVVSSISRSYSGTPVQTQLDNPNTQYPINYIQGLGGVRTRLTFPYLKNLGASIGKVVVNKAELAVSVSAGTDVAPFNPLLRFALYRSDIAGQRSQITDRSYFSVLFGSQQFGDFAYGGYFDSIKKQYVFVITNYIQDILNGKDEDYGIYLAATPQTEFDYLTPTGSTAARTVIGSGAKDAAGNYINPTNRVKLNVYYTKVN